jgi:hypothetical protein
VAGVYAQSYRGAHTLLESACKHILDDARIDYPDDADLPKLLSMSAENLNLAPHQHQEKLFKAILGNCQSIVNSLGALRNKIGDAHGSGRRPVKPRARDIVVKQHSGSIEVDTQPGEFTEIRIILPRKAAMHPIADIKRVLATTSA